MLALVAALISPPAIEIKLSLPLETAYADQPIITRLKLAVTNRSETMLTPRFAVQRNTGSPPFAWKIDAGPARLAPGESADYVISAGAANKAIPASGGGLVVALLFTVFVPLLPVVALAWLVWWLATRGSKHSHASVAS